MVIKFIITQGLGHMHGLNILHRDLKTANILLTKAGVIKLADFGIAKVATRSRVSLGCYVTRFAPHKAFKSIA